MFAIVTIAGQQMKVTEGQEIFVHQLEAAEGDSVNFDQVLLVENDGSTVVGTPVVSGASVGATVLGHQKGDKVIVFKEEAQKRLQSEKWSQTKLYKVKN